jgi:large subunit ribosomal protein L10
MAKTKQQKATLIESLSKIAEKATAAVFVSFKGLSVKDTTEMRRALQNEGVSYAVVKKRLMKRAFEGGRIAGDMPELPGEVALAYTEGADTTLPSRKVYEFSQKHRDKLGLLGGVFEGSFIDQGKAQEIATIPPIDVLRGMFVNVINSPIQGLVIALNQVAEKKN